MVRDPYRYFRIEAKELLEQLNQAALDLEASATPAEPMARLLRLAHTLKGAARVVKQVEMADNAHALEDALAPYRQGEGGNIPREVIDRVLQLVDAMSAQLALLPTSEASSPTPLVASPGLASPHASVPVSAPRTGSAASVTAAATPVPAVQAPAEALRSVRTDVGEFDALLQGFVEVRGELTTLRRFMAEIDDARRTAALLKSGKARFDELERSLARWAHDFGDRLGRAERELDELRALAERMRLTLAGSVFNAFERLLRDSARLANKLVQFEGRGGNVRLDGYVLDIVQPALLQMARNAVAHGIESEAERVRAGKPAAGKVILDIKRRGQQIVFRCSDDGQGVDLKAVESALREQGALPRNPDGYTTAELLKLLLKGGITTATRATDLAGRGIGLDVVRDAVERLHGELSVDTVAGRGTTIELSVPLSLASFDALTFQVGGGVAALPSESVVGARRLLKSDIARSAERQAIEFEGGMIPLIHLADHLAAVPKRASEPQAADEKVTVVLIDTGDGKRAAVVERLLGMETILLHPTPKLAPVTAIILGVYFDAEGNPLPVLSPQALAGLAERQTVQSDAGEEKRPILVIDDSLTTRMLEQSILESAGYTVELATCAEEGLDKARAGDFGLILCDVEMPGMDGFSFVERSRADPQLRKVPCILITSRDSPEDHRRAQTAGASDYIVKGEFDQQYFLKRVAQLLNA